MERPDLIPAFNTYRKNIAHALGGGLPHFKNTSKVFSGCFVVNCKLNISKGLSWAEIMIAPPFSEYDEFSLNLLCDPEVTFHSVGSD